MYCPNMAISNISQDARVNCKHFTIPDAEFVNTDDYEPSHDRSVDEASADREPYHPRSLIMGNSVCVNVDLCVTGLKIGKMIP